MSDEILMFMFFVRSFSSFSKLFKHLQSCFCLAVMSIANYVCNDMQLAFLARKDCESLILANVLDKPYRIQNGTVFTQKCFIVFKKRI